ncbi:lipid A biosynthesis lauroyl acyltransferase [Hydrogenimonas sp.]|uniref:lipid A biosynthesis lauroyl acyltransferase n=1 Tax=Hydrogenimonas sp. TaxID=2231112 RepID=UPI002622954C|nr:lipid A biosynthesis lauroyl acyltransferase [Hydrogenimonas sp.]
MRDYIYLAFYHLFRWLVTWTPEKILFPILRGIARFVWFIDRKHRRIARVNLDLAFGDEMSDEEKERIIRRTYENLVFNLADFIRNQGISKEKLLQKVSFENSEYVENELKAGRPIIAITAHYGHWELLPPALAAKFTPLTIVGRPLDSKAMNEILERNRERFDIKLLPKKGALKGLISALKKGRSVGLLVDQNTREKDGILIDFFGKKARHTPAAAILARRLDLKIVPVFIHSDDHRHYVIKFYPPITMEKTNDKDADIIRSVQAQAKITEVVIREKPDEWFWLHQRWKNQYKHLYETRSR